MSTRNYENKTDSYAQDTGFDNANIPDDLSIPSCTIEDVDRSLFDLFDVQLPFTYKHKQGTRKAPVIFATGERFAVLRRKQPLRDKHGVLILPLVSIMRTGVAQGPTMGAGTAQNVPMTVKQRLSPEDPLYQRLLNKHGFVNSDDLVSNESLQDVTNRKESKVGRIATRSGLVSPKDMQLQKGNIKYGLGSNIYEVITMPPPKYYTATYEVTFWAQYTMQMNDMLSAMMSMYQSFSQRTFRLETPKGYWFVGYVGENLSPGNNFDDFTDNERLVRYSFEVTIPGYIVGPAFPGDQNSLRRYVSAPKISFEPRTIGKDFVVPIPTGPPSGDATDYILDDLRTIDEPLPGQSIGGASVEAASNSRSIFPEISTAIVGNTPTDDNRTMLIEVDKNPLTGKKETKWLHVKTRTNRQGETVLRETSE